MIWEISLLFSCLHTLCCFPFHFILLFGFLGGVKGSSFLFLPPVFYMMMFIALKELDPLWFGFSVSSVLSKCITVYKNHRCAFLSLLIIIVLGPILSVTLCFIYVSVIYWIR